MKFLNTFRGRLLLVFAVLLIATLTVQYYLNVQNELENAERRERVEKALVAGLTLGIISVSSNDRLIQLAANSPSFQEYSNRIADIFVIDNQWQVYDSLNDQYNPKEFADGEMKYLELSELPNLPPLQDDVELTTEERAKFPVAAENSINDVHGETHAVPVQTDRGRYIVLVVLRSEQGDALQRAAMPLIYTLGVLLASTLVGVFLVWRFTQPIKNLSDAARRVANGDLSVRLTDAERTDEIGRLAARFNEMTANLEKTRQLEQQLQQAEKSAVVGRLGSAIAHEIRNPLNYINLTLDHLRAKFAPVNEKERETFERLTAQLKKEVERINGQITDFLRYSRPAKLNLQRVEIRRVVEDSMRIVQAQAEEQNVTVSIIERENVPQILGDAEILRSVFNNLFLNAVQAMGEGGQLKVTISNAGSETRIDVADTGGGIAPENLDNIFEPYFSTKETGTGLGLAIVKKIVEDHNGTIEVASKINEGAVFTVKLPVAKD
ncbi:MAG: ATP-binding protein [Acidobacteriota bacterium]|nr:ATP-binding protein [Acidobacteriota bacterium]